MQRPGSGDAKDQNCGIGELTDQCPKQTHEPRAPVSAYGNASLRRIDVQRPASPCPCIVKGHVEDDVRLRAAGPAEPFEPRPSRRRCLHLQLVVQSEGKVARGGVCTVLGIYLTDVHEDVPSVLGFRDLFLRLK